MNMGPDDELKKVLSGIIKKTQEGKLSWSQVNPTTYTLAKNNLRINVQKIIGNVIFGPNPPHNRPSNYIFTVLDIMNKGSVLSINSHEQPIYREDMQTLFGAASSKMSQMGIEKLKAALMDDDDEEDANASDGI